MQDSHLKLSKEKLAATILSRSLPVAYELITSDAIFIKHFLRSGAVNHRQAKLAFSTRYQLRIQKANLDQHTGLIPVYVLMVQFTSTNAYNHHERNFNMLVRGFYIWQKPRHYVGVRERHVHFINDAVDAGRPRQQFHLQRGGVSGDEVVAVESVEVLIPNAAGHSGDMIDVWLSDHCRHCRVCVFGDKFHFPETIGQLPRGQVSLDSQATWSSQIFSRSISISKPFLKMDNVLDQARLADILSYCARFSSANPASAPGYE